MSKQFKLATLAAAFTLCAGTAFAQDENTSRDTVVATVNGTEITLGHMLIARNGLPDQYRQLPDDVLYQAILDQLVNQAVLADRFEGELPTDLQRRLENDRRSLVASVVIEQIAEEGITDAALKQAYENKYAEAEPDREYKAAHILVETEEEAEALVTELEGGADFAELAKEHSTGPSGPNGGDLGWFSKGMMVAPFEDAVAEMEDGAVSDPVQTQFGWHVIKLNESRLADKPEFESVKAELESELFNELIEKEIERLRKLGNVDIKSSQEIDPSMLSQDDMIAE
ncbi:peptidylprolyl isomerase [Rhodobacteraceae bacterium 63075]|nr:peptidylprolyl isomerase [Rhodobacteraceae bacterium 63075]